MYIIRIIPFRPIFNVESDSEVKYGLFILEISWNSISPLILSLVLLLAMSLMGGALIVISSSDHQSNNTSDEYQQTFYVAETALLQAQKSLMDQMIGPLNRTGGTRNYAARSIPINKGIIIIKVIYKKP